MKWPLLTSLIEHEDDIVTVRQRVRRIGQHLGFGVQDLTRIATAVSEIARNAYSYAEGGKVEYGVDESEEGQSLVVRITDGGPGIAELETILEGRYRSTTGLGIGITGSRRLMDHFEIASAPGRGTIVTFGKLLPPGGERFTGPKLAALADAVARARIDDPNATLREHNRELMRSLAELAEREEEAQRLNQELAETNRGVVALYAELEFQAKMLREAGANLESEVAARTHELADANERLRAEAVERERMEQDLRQSQKMEAVGQLTGGIAHDFNNLLTGIVGSLDLMRSRMAKGRTENLGRYIDTALTSANRAAALTHRLLAFARRQPLDPKPTDANALIVGMSDLLRRTISEAIDLRIETAADLWPTLCDPHQLENAILNLAINARDAMPDGGRLTIQTCNGRAAHARAEPQPEEIPQEHIRIRVSDTGTGMPPGVIARAFDPFFTTKPLGQGTGLGLSMIYGFIRQSEGHATIASEVGEGTTIDLYLPRHYGEAEAATSDEGVELQPGRGETILVVEDEAMVREVVVEVLQDLGYRVLQAVDGLGGLQIIKTAARIDLLITDVGLPGLNGRQLADQAREHRSDLKVLFITGYAETMMHATSFLEPGMAMITKPFSVETLVARMRAMIESPAL